MDKSDKKSFFFSFFSCLVISSSWQQWHHICRNPRTQRFPALEWKGEKQMIIPGGGNFNLTIFRSRNSKKKKRNIGEWMVIGNSIVVSLRLRRGRFRNYMRRSLCGKCCMLQAWYNKNKNTGQNVMCRRLCGIIIGIRECLFSSSWVPAPWIKKFCSVLWPSSPPHLSLINNTAASPLFQKRRRER